MGLHHLDHYNIETVNLDETIKFYCDVLGLYVGDRPPLPIPGRLVVLRKQTADDPSHRNEPGRARSSESAGRQAPSHLLRVNRN